MRKRVRRLNKWFLIILSGMFLVGCGSKNSVDTDMENATVTPEITEPAAEEDKPEYEDVFSETIQINGQEEEIKIVQNVQDVKDVIITVGNDNAVLDRVSIDAGYNMTQIKTLDCTGDGSDEIILFLQGGASGAWNEVQVFTENGDGWVELPLPSSLWESDFVSFDRKNQKLFVEVGETNTRQKISVQTAEQDEDCGIRYRLCKINKKNEIVIHYEIYCGDLDNIVGQVKQTLHYDNTANAFVYGKTEFSLTGME